MSRDFDSYRHSLHLFETEKKKAITAYENNVITRKNSNAKLLFRYVAKKDKHENKSVSLRDEGNIVSGPSRCGDI